MCSATFKLCKHDVGPPSVGYRLNAVFGEASRHRHAIDLVSKRRRLAVVEAATSDQGNCICNLIGSPVLWLLFVHFLLRRAVTSSDRHRPGIGCTCKSMPTVGRSEPSSARWRHAGWDPIPKPPSLEKKKKKKKRIKNKQPPHPLTRTTKNQFHCPSG